MSPRAIYVERHVDGPLEAVWERTQDPAAHERWDLRFSTIEYATVDDGDADGDDTATDDGDTDRADSDDTDIDNADRDDAGEGNGSRAFTYRTHVGFGLSVAGTGEFLATNDDGEETTSVLAFASDDPKSLIDEGRGFWRYVETGSGLRFLTEYNYDPRWGRIGRIVDRLAFRPLLGWATAYSFDVLARWVEDGTPPETSYRAAVTHAVATVALASIWVYQGLVPKLIADHPRETAAMEALGFGPLASEAVVVLGVAEVLFGVALLAVWRSRLLALLGGLLAIPLVAGSVAIEPSSALDPVNTVVTAIGMVSLGVVAAVLVPDVPTARTCLRSPPDA